MDYPPFIRYYLRNSTPLLWEKLKTAIPELGEWTITSSSDFLYKESYEFSDLPGSETGHQRVKYALEHSEVILECHDPSLLSPSSLFTDDKALTSSFVDDLLALLSVARGTMVHFVLREYSNGSNTINWSAISPFPDDIGISVIGSTKVPQFVGEALKMICDRNRLPASGLYTAIPWHGIALRTVGREPTVFTLALYWVCLEALANARNETGKKHRMALRLLQSLGMTGEDWDNLQELVKDWYEVRNFAFHEGRQPEWPISKFILRLKQIRQVTAIAICHLLVPYGPEELSALAAQVLNVP